MKKVLFIFVFLFSMPLWAQEVHVLTWEWTSDSGSVAAIVYEALQESPSSSFKHVQGNRIILSEGVGRNSLVCEAATLGMAQVMSYRAEWTITSLESEWNAKGMWVVLHDALKKHHKRSLSSHQEDGSLSVSDDVVTLKDESLSFISVKDAFGKCQMRIIDKGHKGNLVSIPGLDEALGKLRRATHILKSSNDPIFFTEGEIDLLSGRIAQEYLELREAYYRQAHRGVSSVRIIYQIGARLELGRRFPSALLSENYILPEALDRLRTVDLPNVIEVFKQHLGRVLPRR